MTYIRRLDLIGQVYGKLTVQSYAGSKNYKSLWNCVCECGGSKITTGNALRSGLTLSCGCLRAAGLEHRKKHGLSTHSAYKVWLGMIDRCQNQNSKDFKYYGGRGITVCERWQSVENFIQDMGYKPAGASIDRIDVNGPYSPENCRWADSKTQGANKRNNVRICINGEWMHIAEASRRTGVPETTLRRRAAA